MADLPFPSGLTLDEALQRGWRPDERSAFIVDENGIIRDRSPVDDVIDLALYGPSRSLPKRRRSGNSAPDRIRATMARYAKARRQAKADKASASDILHLVAAVLDEGGPKPKSGL